MDRHVRNSLMKTALALVIGIGIGASMLVKGLPWYCMLIAPPYCVGFAYGISKIGPIILKFLGSMLKAAGSLFLFRLFYWIFLVLLIIPIGLIFLLAACWLIGFPLAIVDIVKALRDISQKRGNRVMNGDPSADDDDEEHDYDSSEDYDDDY
ncbi:MAG: hypothetical protein SPK32_06555 [Bacteroidaceae bacterium]|nr:hypothetical protein [Bacteroidaceae bacterium]